MTATGKRYNVIAALLGRSVCSIKNKCQALRCFFSDAAPLPWTGEEEQLLLEMAAAQFSYKAMANTLKRTMPMVKCKLKALRQLC
jgi:hypothetical protein